MPVLHTREELEAQIAGFLRVRPEEIKGWKSCPQVHRCQKREDLKMVYTIYAEITAEKKILAKGKHKILCLSIRSGIIFQCPVMRNFFTRRS